MRKDCFKKQIKKSLKRSHLGTFKGTEEIIKY